MIEWWGNEACYPSVPKPYPQYIQDYLDRVMAADAAAGNSRTLETEVIDAIAVCLQDLVTDGILGISGGVLSRSASRIKAACFMMGANTLQGALVPLAADMPAPTNVNFTGSQFNRRTGLLGDGATTYLNSNRADNADPQNNYHLAAHATTLPSIGNTYLAVRNASTYNNHLLSIGTRSRSTSAYLFNTTTTGFTGLSRASSASYTHRNNTTSVALTQASQTPVPDSILVFARADSGSVSSYSNARLNFYSIGESLDLAVLDARITALSNTIQAAIAP